MRPFIPLFFLTFGFCFSYGQTGPAGVGMNDGSSALKLWLDASKGVSTDTFGFQVAKEGDRVKLWKDLSGNDNHVMAQLDSVRPAFTSSSALLNGASALRFSRNATKENKRNFLVSKSFAKTNDITIYCVFHALTKSDGNNITPYKSSTYGPNMWYAGSGLVDAGAVGLTNDISLAMCDTSIAAGAGDSTTKTDYCVKTPVSLNKSYFAALQKEAWTGKLSIAQNNGMANEFQAGAQPINNPVRYYIGSNSNVSSTTDSPFFDGYISSILVYNRLLTSAEKVILENYLAAKYALPLKQNDYYTFDDSAAGNYDHELIGIGKASDGSFQTSAKGEGIFELTNPSELDKGDFLFIGHNGKPNTTAAEDIPEGLQQKLERTWVCSKMGNTKTVDLLLDASSLSAISKDDLVLLIDTDNNGLFSDETFGKGILPMKEVTSHGRYAFRGVSLQHGNHFTFGKLKNACKSNCDSYFSPNNDGVSDLYYLDQPGKTAIYDRSGNFITSMATPAYWDGTNERGEMAIPGLYFLIINEDAQKTVTLIR